MSKPNIRIQNAEPTQDLLTPRPVRIPRASDGSQTPASLGRDATLPPGEAPKFRRNTKPFVDVVRDWRNRIEREQLFDVQVRHYRTPTTTAPEGFFLRDTDGAFMRKPDGEGLAYTERGWAQLVNLLMQEIPGKPRNPVEAFRWCEPSVRSVIFDSLKARSHRKEGAGHEILLRSFIDQATGVRALRAVVSGRHSGIHFDDLAVIETLEKVITPVAPTYCQREQDFTSGYAILSDTGDVRASIHWSNSETGAASISFGAGCFITALDAIVRDGRTLATDRNLEDEETQPTRTTHQVRVTSTSGRTRRAHTLPRKNRTEADRAKIALERMAADVAKATDASLLLAKSWAEALQTFAKGWNREGHTYSRSMAATVLLDLIEMHTRGFADNDRKALEQILVDNDRLFALPFGSAAHIAGAWAVLASHQEDLAEATRMQNEAGRWVINRFGDDGERREPPAPRFKTGLEDAMNH
jgi:hypothetical protein